MHSDLLHDGGMVAYRRHSALSSFNLGTEDKGSVLAA